MLTAHPPGQPGLPPHRTEPLPARYLVALIQTPAAPDFRARRFFDLFSQLMVLFTRLLLNAFGRIPSFGDFPQIKPACLDYSQPYRAVQADLFPTSQWDQDSQINHHKAPGQDLGQLDRETKLRWITKQEIINQMGVQQKKPTADREG